MAGRIQLRRGTAANWTSANPTLFAGEVGVETDTGRMKVGTGTAAWNTLPYVDAVNFDHPGDPTNAHMASAIGFTPTGTISANNVQAAIAELDSDSAALTAHLTDAVDAHDASAISFTPTATIAATDVQAAIAEVDAEHVATSVAAPRTVAAMSSTISNFVSTPDLAALSGATELDIRWIEFGNAGSSGIIIGQAATGSSGISFIVLGSPGDDVRLGTSSDGTTTTITAATGTGIVRPATGVMGAVRVTWRSSDGRMQSFAKATSSVADMLDNAGWTQTGVDGTAGTAALFNSSAPVTINTYADGSSPANVQMMAASIATTIGGTPIALFRADSPAAPRFVDVYGNTWTYNGSAYSFRHAAT